MYFTSSLSPQPKFFRRWTGPEAIKKFKLYSAEHEFFQLINVKMPTNVRNLTFMSRKIVFLSLSEPEKAEFLDIFVLMSI